MNLTKISGSLNKVDRAHYLTILLNTDFENSEISKYIKNNLVENVLTKKQIDALPEPLGDIYESLYNKFTVNNQPFYKLTRDWVEFEKTLLVLLDNENILPKRIVPDALSPAQLTYITYIGYVFLIREFLTKFFSDISLALTMGVKLKPFEHAYYIENSQTLIEAFDALRDPKVVKDVLKKMPTVPLTDENNDAVMAIHGVVINTGPIAIATSWFSKNPFFLVGSVVEAYLHENYLEREKRVNRLQVTIRLRELQKEGKSNPALEDQIELLNNEIQKIQRKQAKYLGG